MARGAGMNSHLNVKVTLGEKPACQASSATGKISWGPKKGNEIDFPVTGVSGSEELFKPAKSGAKLIYRPGMKGELYLGSSSVKIEDAPAWGMLHGTFGPKYINISRDMDGWFEYRGLTVNFSFGEPIAAAVQKPAEKPAKTQVAPQPAAAVQQTVMPDAFAATAPKVKQAAPTAKVDPRHANPKFKRTTDGRMDPRFNRTFLLKEDGVFYKILSASYALAMMFILAVAIVQLPPPPKIDITSEKFAKLIYKAPQAKTRVKQEIDKQKGEEQAAKKTEKKEEAQKEVAKVEEKVVEKAPSSSAPPTPGLAPEPTFQERKEAIRKEVSKKGILGVLGGRGGVSTSRRVTAVVGGASMSQNLDNVLSEVKGVTTGPGSSGDDWKGQKIDTKSSFAVDAAKVANKSQKVVQLESRTDAKVESVDTAKLENLDMKEAIAVLHRTVETYLGQLKYLYNKELRKNPALEGKITVSITVTPEGTVSDVRVVENTMKDASELESGIVARIKRWTFPQVAQKNLTVTYPFVFFPSM